MNNKNEQSFDENEIIEDDAYYNNLIMEIKRKRAETKRLRDINKGIGIDIEAMLCDELTKQINQSIIDNLCKMRMYEKR